MTSDILKTFEQTLGNGYIRLDSVSAVNDTYTTMIALLTFMAFLLFLKILRFNRRIGLLGVTIQQCWDDLLSFSVVFVVFFLSFVNMFYLFLNPYLLEWSTYQSSLATAFAIMLGKFNFDSMRETNIAAAVFFFFFSVSMTLIMMNILFVIIIQAFEVVKSEINRHPRDFEIVDFYLERAKAFIGLGQARSADVTPVDFNRTIADSQNAAENQSRNKSEELPFKVDAMLQYVNSIYFDSRLPVDETGWGRRTKILAKRRIEREIINK
jgi:hypothetical protein